MPLYRKLPQRGFNRARFQTDIAVVNLSKLNDLNSDKVNLETLKAAGLIRSNAKFVKILGSGDISKALQVEVNSASASAAKKIEAAGGSVTLA